MTYKATQYVESSWSAIESGATAYAAIVATGVFFLELRRWFDERPKLAISVVPDGVVLGGEPRYEERDLTIVHIVNRGSEPTTIENLFLWEFSSVWSRWRRKPVRSFVIPNPQLKGYPQNIPKELEPNRRWTGVIRKRQDVIADLQTGNFFVGISASHTDRILFKQIPKRKPRLPKGTTLLRAPDENMASR